MIYVTSDLHGLEITKLKALLKKACFNENDRLFVLGDVIDRQNDGGVAILIWLSEQPNAQLILGNHEAMLLSCDFVFNEITEESIKHFDKEQTELLNNYIQFRNVPYYSPIYNQYYDAVLFKILSWDIAFSATISYTPILLYNIC